MPVRSVILCSLALAVARPAVALDDPCAHLYDTVSPGQAAARREHWQLVQEGKTEHTFRGDAALTNDRLIVLVPRQTRGVQVYAHTPRGIERRAVIGSNERGRLSSWAICQNDASAVDFAAVFSADDGSSKAMRFRITAGQPLLRITAGRGMGKFVVSTRSRYVVVPDFFGDDMVFDAAGSRLALPAESFLVHMLTGGDAMLMCVWQGDERPVHLAPGGRTEIGCAPGSQLWLALLEGERTWAERIQDWQPPFDAKWRVSVMGQDGDTTSQAFAAQSVAAGQRAIVYPIDRSRSTPLDVFCLTDVMRNTLGCGPCQYLLDREGFDPRERSTPADVTQWIERLFKRKRDRRSADQIRERLKLMGEHVRRADARVGQYEDLATQLQRICADEPAPALRRLAAQMQQAGADCRRVARPADAAALADQIAALIGKPNALAECQRLGAQLRSIGAAQDRALSKCRMGVRRMKLLCRDAAAGDVRRRVLDLLEQFSKSKG